jgi:hypothetical protein
MRRCLASLFYFILTHELAKEQASIKRCVRKRITDSKNLAGYYKLKRLFCIQKIRIDFININWEKSGLFGVSFSHITNNHNIVRYNDL